MLATLSKSQLSELTFVFESESLEIFSETFHMLEEAGADWERVGTRFPFGFWRPEQDFLANIEDYKYNRFLDIGNKFQKNNILLICDLPTGVYPNYLFLFKNILVHLRENLVFKNHTRIQVDQCLKKIREEEGSGKEIIFIGVHCRRTDYEKHMKVIFLSCGC